jgi:predicted alpha/beta superfamily hydrolase
VQVVVVGPDATSAAGAPNHVYLASAHEGWNPGALAIPGVAPGVYVQTLMLPAGTWLEYKFCRDPTWATVEKTAAGGEVPNRGYQVPEGVREVVLLHRVERWADRPPEPTRSVVGMVTTAATTQPSTRTGDIRVHRRIPAPAFNNDRDVLVWLPPGYDANAQRRYPVVYFLDGRNVFDAATSFSGVEWQADETAARLIAAGQIEPLILVAIENTAERLAEYTPAADPEHGGGGADDYLTFIDSTVKPLIDAAYRTKPQPAHTAIVGASVAGVFAAYAPCRRPDLFGRAAALDPALGWANEALVKFAENQPPPPEAHLWLSVGTGVSGENSGAADPMGMFARHLSARGAEVREVAIPGGRHHERDWAEALDDVLLFLFPETRAGRPDRE